MTVLSSLQPLYTFLLGAGGTTTAALIFKFMGWFRNNRVEDRTTETTRLEAENKRLTETLLEVRKELRENEDRLDSTREQMFREQEYSSSLRAQLIGLHEDPRGRKD